MFKLDILIDERLEACSLITDDERLFRNILLEIDYCIIIDYLNTMKMVDYLLTMMCCLCKIILVDTVKWLIVFVIFFKLVNYSIYYII